MEFSGAALQPWSSNSSSLPPSQRKRASKACRTCRVRKIRCDATLKQAEQPCSYCSSLGAVCVLEDESWRSKKRKVVESSARVQPRSLQTRGSAPDSRDRAPSFNDSLISTGATPVGPQVQDATEGSGLRSPDKVWTSPLDFVDAPAGADGLVGEHPSNDNEVPPSSAQGTLNPILASTSDKRIVYADDTLTHSVLPHMSGHRSFNVSAGRDASNAELSDLTMIQVTITCPRLTSSTWYERRLDRATSGPFSHLLTEDITYLCTVKQVLAFPPVNICDCLMDSFLQHFLPAYPVADKNELQKTYLSFRRGVLVSPLLIHSIFFASCQYVDEAILQGAGFEKRYMAQEYFHHRAALLYSLDCEKNQLVLVQSLIFMSPWWKDYSEEKNIRFWTTCACNTALSMGLHKAIPPSSKLSPHQRSLWRRIFWTLFVRDRNVALGLGRPPMINLDDVDVELLSELDFYESEGHEAVKSSDDCPVEFQRYNNVHGAFMMDMVKLSMILSEVFRMNAAREKDVEPLLPRLFAVRTRLEHIELASERALRVQAEGGNANEHSIWPISAEINRQRILALAQRVIHKLIVERGFQNSIGITVPQIRGGIVKCAAKTISLYEELFTTALLKYGHSFFALITYLEEIKENTRDSGRAQIAVNKIQLGLLILGDMRQYWSAARWGHSLFKFCMDRDFSFLPNLPRPSRWPSPAPAPAPAHVSRTAASPTELDEDSSGFADLNFGEATIWDASFFESHQLFADGILSHQDQLSNDLGLSSL